MRKILSSFLSLVIALTSVTSVSSVNQARAVDALKDPISIYENQNIVMETDWLNAPIEEPPIPDVTDIYPIMPENGPELVTVEESVYESEDSTSDDIYASSQMMLMNNYPPPDPSILSAINNINIRTPGAPYSIDSQQESISTLNGNLSISTTDLSLPGRNGLSFDLKRVYDASNADFFEKNVELYLFCVCKVEHSGARYLEREDVNSGNATRSLAAYGRFYFDPTTHPYMNNLFDAFGLMQYINEKAGQDAFQTNWSATDSNGFRYRDVWEISHDPQVTYTDIYSGPTIMWYRNKTKDKTSEELLFPIGKGWSWNIPFIKTVEGKRYLNMQDSGTYEITGSSLKGYPFQDLSVAYNSSVHVNGVASSTEVKSIKGPNHYFDADGRLIRIADRYDNTVDFHYSNHPTYGKVLTSIIDAIGNAINITYNTNQVVLTQGSKTVRYNKYEYTTYDPLPPFRALKTEILSSVSDAMNRTTSYSYSMQDTAFSLVDSTPSKMNKTAFLTSIYHPTGAATSYTYESAPFTRKIGTNAVQNVYRIASRKDVASGVTYNLRSFTYTNPQGVTTDYASSYGQNISNFYVNVNDGLTTTVFDYRKKVASENDTPQFYTNKVTATAGDEQRITTYQYDETRKIPYPIQTNEQFKKGTVSAPAVQSSVTYDNYGNLLTETNPLGITTTYTYDPTSHLLATITNPVNSGESRYTKLDRNPQGSITQMTVRHNDAAGAIMAQVKYEDFDSHGNARRTLVADDNRTITYETEFEDAIPYLEGFPTRQTIDTENYLGQPETITTELSYDSKTGLVLSSKDGRGNETNYEYDLADRLVRVTNPDDSFSTAVYTDGSSQQVIITDETGVKTRMRWDRLGNLMDEAVLDGSYRMIRSFGYDAYERQQWEKDNLSRTTTFEYDDWSRLKRSINPDSSYEMIDYDEINRQKIATDAVGNKWRSTSDILGQVVLSEEWREGQFKQTSAQVYDYEGNVLSQTNATDTTTYTYDVLGRVIKAKDALNKEYIYEYTLGGLLKSIQYPDGNQVLKEYDELGRLIRQTNEIGLEDKYKYDLSSNMTTYIDRKGQSFTYTYDDRNFLIQKVAPDETIDYTYDLAGRRKTMKDSTGTLPTRYEYKNTTGELTRVTYPDNNYIAYTYNSLGLRSTMRDPFGSVTHYTYDNRNRLTGVGPSTTNQDVAYTYYTNNLVKDITLKNGNKSILTYEGLRLHAMINQKAEGTQLQSFTYTYDGNGNITDRSTTQAGITIDEDFTYDPLNRIQTASQFDETYSYDNRDNRFTLQSNQPLSNLALADRSYMYDSQNRLIHATVDEQEVTYLYNGDGMLYERTENGESTRYYYDGPNIIAEGMVTANGTTTFNTRYIRGHQLAARQDASSKSYYLHNGHGDVVELRDSTGNMSLNSYSYDMWGNPSTTSETVYNPFRYSGELWDSTTELQYLRARWYDPSIGRFINKDTYEGELGNPLTLNLYTYTANNPMRYIDPSGHCFTEWLGKKYCQAAWDAVKQEATETWEFLKDVHSSWYSAVDYWTLGTLTQLENYYNLSMENPYSLEQFLAAGMIFIEITPQGKTAKLTDKGSDFIKKAINPCNCFTAGTKVLTDEGEKNIEDIEVGDKVLAKDEFNPDGELAYKEVTALYRNQRDDIIKLYVGEQVIETTDNHPFWVEGRGWVFADELVVGDKLQEADGSNLTIDKVEFVKLNEPVTVYNFTVADYHTYYVTDLGIWVHNTQCGFASGKKLSDHYRSHKAEFGNITKDEYLQGARKLVSSNVSSANIFYKVRSDGVSVFYNSSTNEFAAVKDGVIRTYFKPDPKKHGYKTNMDYFNNFEGDFDY